MEQLKLALSVRETAEALGLSENNVRTQIREGRIPSIRINKRILISRVELEKLLRGPGGLA